MAQASDKEREIHQLILLKDDLAFAKFCDEYYGIVHKKVSAFNRQIAQEDEALIIDVVTDSFLKYFNDPTRYNPEKQSLEKFLIMDAEGDLKNALEKIKRKNKNIDRSVELGEKIGNSSMENEELNPIDQLINKEATDILEHKLKDLFTNEKDIQLAHLMLSGERKSTEFAKILEIEHLEPEEQRSEIKKQKDRIDKVIRRKLRNHE